jgi:TM2 domain-containing membrane protein YozV
MTEGNLGDVALDRNPDAEREASEYFETHEDKEKRLRNEDLEQDIRERQKYAKRSFNLTCVWIGFIMVSTAAQFVLNAIGKGIDRYQFVTLITTTNGTVLGFWLLVGRYLFRTVPPVSTTRIARPRADSPPSGTWGISPSRFCETIPLRYQRSLSPSLLWVARSVASWRSPIALISTIAWSVASRYANQTISNQLLSGGNMSGFGRGLGTQELILIEQRVTNDGRSVAVAYLLWLFLGVLSAHRFYLHRPGTAILQILLNCIAVGLVWTLIDAFLIPGMVRNDQAKLRDRLIREATAGMISRP